ncbi:Esterase [Dactylella cylindrospora]|nr:Esterase [Dactylella cylindrospora]
MSFQPEPAESNTAIQSNTPQNEGPTARANSEKHLTGAEDTQRSPGCLSALGLRRKAKQVDPLIHEPTVPASSNPPQNEASEKDALDLVVSASSNTAGFPSTQSQPIASSPKLPKAKKTKEQYPKLAEPDRPISVDNPSIFAGFMESSPSALLKILVPKLPLMGKTFAYHALGVSQTAHYWDLKTELLITMIRSFVARPTPEPLSKSQHVSLKDPGIKGRMWVSKVPVPAPTGPETRQIVIDAINSLIQGDKFDWTAPELPEASAEWTGYREGVPKDAPQLDISEAEKYAKLMEEVKSDVTIYYIHGGAMYLMDPASHRPVVARLAKETKGRALSFRYRLAPQNPFPAALMDCFLGYLYLLYPPPGSLHEPVNPKKIVICGDSAGGNLTASLIALLLTIRRISPTGITHNGKIVDLPLPAGIAVNSPWTDTTHSFPSVNTNKNFDYIPSPSIYPGGKPIFPKCDIWPTNPPRTAIYVEDRLWLHPLVNPISFRDWSGAPPALIMVGQELLTDEGKFFAKHLTNNGVTVQFEEYQAMPHCFAMLMDWVPGTAKCFNTWSKFISDAVEGNEIKAKATKTLAKSLREEVLDLRMLSEFEFDQVQARMKESAGHDKDVEDTRAKL